MPSDGDCSATFLVLISHQAKLITLWELDYIGTEEGWDMEALY